MGPAANPGYDIGAHTSGDDDMRRTIYLPDELDARIKELALPGESYSATVARLVDEGATVMESQKPPSFIGIWKDGPAVHLGRDFEDYLFGLKELPDADESPV
jgi:hypothetical protein